MASNRSAFLDKAGELLRVGDAPFPKPGPKDIIIKNHAIAINPLDAAQYAKGVMIKSFPAVLGSDVAGEVYEIGSEVTNIKKGDRVVGHAWAFTSGQPQDGAYTLYSNVPAGNSAIIPENISYNEAAVLPMAIDTASSGLFSDGSLNLKWPYESSGSTGQTIIVYGASSSVGSMAVQLATLSGYRVLAVASKKNADLVKESGAEDVFDYNDADVVDQIVKAIDPSTFVGIFDSIGNPSSHNIVVPIFEKLGGKARYTSSKAIPETLPAGVESKRMYGIGEFSFPLWQKTVSEALKSGKLKTLPKPEVVGKGLESLQSAVEQISKGVSGKKLVVEL